MISTRLGSTRYQRTPGHCFFISAVAFAKPHLPSALVARNWIQRCEQPKSQPRYVFADCEAVAELALLARCPIGQLTSAEHDGISAITFAKPRVLANLFKHGQLTKTLSNQAVSTGTATRLSTVLNQCVIPDYMLIAAIAFA